MSATDSAIQQMRTSTNSIDRSLQEINASLKKLVELFEKEFAPAEYVDVKIPHEFMYKDADE
jgi:hypothetical protein